MIAEQQVSWFSTIDYCLIHDIHIDYTSNLASFRLALNRQVPCLSQARAIIFSIRFLNTLLRHIIFNQSLKRILN